MAAPTGRRVVVTGIGAISPVGTGAEQTWAALQAGVSGAGPIRAFDASGLPVRIAAEVDGFDGDERFGKRRARHLDRFVQLALVATEEALASSGLDLGVVGERTGVVYGSGIGGIATLESQILLMADKGPGRVSPYMCPMMIPNMAAGEIAMAWDLLGPNTCTVTACAASSHAIGDAADMIRLGRADVMVAGGSEAAITPICIAGFTAMKALSERNDDPTAASRPFDVGRDGFVSGEGAATLVLEEYEHAAARGATILAEVVGYGLTSDAHHITAPHPEGSGAIRAMRMALDQAQVDPSAVGYVNAHGTSTPPNDRIESLALREVFGEDGPAVSSTKSMTGHLLGAAGALEAIVSVLAIRDGVLPPTINLTDPEPECALDHVACEAREQRVDVVLSNSFGFGGHNGTLLFQRI